MFALKPLSRSLAVIALSCMIATGAAAEVKVGDKAVPIEADKIVNSKIKKLKELKHSLVLYEYFAYW